MRRRSGLTLVEVIIILVLGLLLISFFLAFTGRGREVSQRVECIHRLKILGEAINFYHGTEDKPGKGSLPAARIAEDYGSWPVMLGPYLAKTDPFAEWDLRKSYESQAAAARELKLPLFLCPGRDRAEALSREGDLNAKGEHLPGVLGDYACASANGDPLFPWTGPQANGSIILGEVLEEDGGLILRWKSRTNRDSLKRGLSVTILLGEKHAPPDMFGDAAAGDGSMLNGANPASFARIGGTGYGLAKSPTDPFNTNFGSAHPGLCNFLHADGSVQTYSISLEERVLGRLIDRELQDQ